MIVLAISLSGLLIVTLFLHFGINKHFQDYLYQARKENINELVNLLESNMEEGISWQEVIRLVDEFSRVNGVNLYLADQDNNLVYTANRMMGNNRGHMGMMGQGRLEENINLETMEVFPLEVNSRNIGKLYWRNPPRQQLITSQSEIFSRNINRVIILTALFIAFLTIVMSYFFSRNMTEPLLEINQVAGRVAAGDFSQKVNVRGKDEIAELGLAFNDMIVKLQQLEEIREESTSDLAHELRTPITNMKSYLEGIEDGILQPDRETLAEIQEEMDRMCRLIDRLQELTEIENKIVNLDKIELNLYNVLRTTVEQFKILTSRKGIKLVENYSGQKLFVYGNPDSLKTIFNNLLSNAVKYTEKGGQILIGMKKEGDRAVIQIEDTGIGIPSEELPYIFERFYRTDKSRSTETGGTGIGLTITRKLVQAHGGAITAASGKQRTIFTVFLPAR